MICASTSALLPLLLPLPRVPPPHLRAAGTPLEPLEPSASYFSGPAEEELFLAQLQRRVDELERLLPGLDVPALLEREPDLVENPHVLTRVVALQEALPRARVATLVRRAPGLLLVKDARANLAALQTLLPGADLTKLLHAAPTLLLRTPAGIGAKIDALQAALGRVGVRVRVGPPPPPTATANPKQAASALAPAVIAGPYTYEYDEAYQVRVRGRGRGRARARVRVRVRLRAVHLRVRRGVPGGRPRHLPHLTLTLDLILT